MPNYFYAISLFVAYAYIMIHDIYSFNKGKYSPYVFRKVKSNTKQKIFNSG